LTEDHWLAGVDGCRAGWVAAFVRPRGDEVRVRVVNRFVDVANAPERPTTMAVDIPIGLPDRIGRDGRGPEGAVRPLLGMRQSSVFSVPSRAAIYAEDFGAACHIAALTSDPPRRVSRQLFMITPKIREVDAVLRGSPVLAGRVFEVHPEVAFWRLNGGRALGEPKKLKGVTYPPGLALRRELLKQSGCPAGVADQAPPPGAAADDLLDALACAMVAQLIHAGVAIPFPDPPQRDRYGLMIAIWA